MIESFEDFLDRENQELEAEAERLKEALEEIRNRWPRSEPFESDADCAAAMREIAAQAIEGHAPQQALREALQRIADGDVPGEGDWGDCVQEFARATLAAHQVQS